MNRNRRMSIVLIVMVISLCLTGVIFASSEVKIQVVFQDGTTSGVVELLRMEEGVFVVQGSSKETYIPLHSIGAIYFIDGGSTQSQALKSPKSYRLGGMVYTVGYEEGVFSAYGPTGLKITDPNFLKDLKDLDKATVLLRDKNLEERLKDYRKTVITRLGYSWIQRQLTETRDFAVGIAANAIATLFSTANPAELALRIGLDITQEQIESLMDPAKYLYYLAAGNLIYLRNEIGNLMDMINQIPDRDGQVFDGDALLKTVEKYYMIFTLYQPTLDLLDSLTPSGELEKQLQEVGANIASKFAGELSPSTNMIMRVQAIDEQIRSGLGFYEEYKQQIEQNFNSLKAQMPFLDTETTTIKDYLGYFIVEFGTKVVNASTREQREKQYESVFQNLHSTFHMPPSMENSFTSPSRITDLTNPEPKWIKPKKETYSKSGYIELRAGVCIPVNAFNYFYNPLHSSREYVSSGFLSFYIDLDTPIEIPYNTILKMINLEERSEKNSGLNKFTIALRNGKMWHGYISSSTLILNAEIKDPFSQTNKVMDYDLYHSIKEIKFPDY